MEASNISLPPDEPHFSATNGDQNNQKSDTNRFLPINSDDDDDIIGPKLPANAVQEQTDYMNRLIEFKTNKEHVWKVFRSNSLKIEKVKCHLLCLALDFVYPCDHILANVETKMSSDSSLIKIGRS